MYCVGFEIIKNVLYPFSSGLFRLQVHPNVIYVPFLTMIRHISRCPGQTSITNSRYRRSRPQIARKRVPNFCMLFKTMKTNTWNFEHLFWQFVVCLSWICPKICAISKLSYSEEPHYENWIFWTKKLIVLWWNCAVWILTIRGCPVIHTFLGSLYTYIAQIFQFHLWLAPSLMIVSPIL